MSQSEFEPSFLPTSQYYKDPEKPTELQRYILTHAALIGDSPQKPERKTWYKLLGLKLEQTAKQRALTDEETDYLFVTRAILDASEIMPIEQAEKAVNRTLIEMYDGLNRDISNFR